LAPASRYEEVVDMVTETIAAAPQGDPLDPTTVFGPSANRSQYNSVLEHLESAKAEGARFTTGGEAVQLNDELAEGLFIQPTVLANVTPEMRVARKEIFGPVITILKYNDLDEAISLANNTELCLGGI